MKSQADQASPSNHHSESSPHDEHKDAKSDHAESHHSEAVVENAEAEAKQE